MKRLLAAVLLLTTFLLTGISFADTIDDDPAVSLSGSNGSPTFTTINSNADWPANPVPVVPVASAAQYKASFAITSLLISASPLPTTDFSKYSCFTAFGMSCIKTMDTVNNIIYFYLSGGTISANTQFGLSAQSSSGLAWGDHETFTVQANVPNVPEPGSLMLFGSGLATVAGVLRRKLRK